jgi:hypothetical protein
MSEAARSARRGDECVEHDEDIEWIVVRRYDDPIEAQMALDYLRTTGVPVALQGNSGATSILNRFDTVLDIRLVVPEDAVEDAHSALDALECPPPASDREAPYRGPLPPESSAVRKRARPQDDVKPRRRYRRAAFALAFALPFGGGHFYAQHGAAGAMFAAGALAGVIGSMVSQRPEPLLATLILALIDAMTSPSAVIRFNEERVPDAGRQRLLALLAIVVAYAAAWALASMT